MRLLLLAVIATPAIAFWPTGPQDPEQIDWTKHVSKACESRRYGIRLSAAKRVANGGDAAIHAITAYIETHGLNSISPSLVDMIADAKVHPAVLKLLARAHQNLGDTEAEIKSLLQIFEVSDDDLEACKRLIELQVERKDWDDVRLATRYFLSINPLQVEPHRVLAEAGEALNDAATTVRALECLLEFETTDLASAHYRIARIKLDLGEKASARRHVDGVGRAVPWESLLRRKRIRGRRPLPALRDEDHAAG